MTLKEQLGDHSAKLCLLDIAHLTHIQLSLVESLIQASRCSCKHPNTTSSYSHPVSHALVTTHGTLSLVFMRDINDESASVMLLYHRENGLTQAERSYITVKTGWHKSNALISPWKRVDTSAVKSSTEAETKGTEDFTFSSVSVSPHFRWDFVVYIRMKTENNTGNTGKYSFQKPRNLMDL